MAEKPAKANIEPPREKFGRTKGNLPENLEPPPETEDIKNRKWNPQDQIGILKVLPKGQGVEIHIVKLKNNGRKSDRASLVRIKTGGASALPTNPKKGRADKRRVINVDRYIDASNMEKNMHNRMTLD